MSSCHSATNSLIKSLLKVSSQGGRQISSPANYCCVASSSSSSPLRRAGNNNGRNGLLRSRAFQQRRFYSKLSVREKKLLQQQMEQEEKKQLVQSYMNKYFRKSPAARSVEEAPKNAGGDISASAAERLFEKPNSDDTSLSTSNTNLFQSDDHSASTNPLLSKLSVQKYKHQNQVEKIIQLELARKRNSANPKAKTSPGRVNVRLLQKDIDEQLYHTYSRKFFQHGFDVFIAKLRRESQANHKTRKVFCLDNRSIRDNFEQRISALVTEKQLDKESLKSSAMMTPLEDEETLELIEKITSSNNESNHGAGSFLTVDDSSQAQSQDASANTETDQQLMMKSEYDEDFDEEDEVTSSTPPRLFELKDTSDDVDVGKYTDYLQRETWFTDDIDDDFETLNYSYNEEELGKVSMWN